jgi:hypothetical protein
MNIPLTLGNYVGRSGAANAMELVNLMVESDQQGGSAPFTLVGTPGCSEFGNSGTIGEGRGGFQIPGKVLFIVDKEVYTIDTTTAAISAVGTLTTTNGATFWSENPTQVLLTDGAKGYVYTKANGTFNAITDPDFPVPKASCFKDGWGVVVEASTGKFYVSALNDFTSWGTLDFTTAEYEPDNLVTAISSHDSLYALGTKTTQTYYNSGNSYFPFDNRAGANMTIGCGATSSPAKGKNLLFWLDEDGIVRMIDGYAQSTVSTRQIEYIIANLVTYADARGFVYTQEGHLFYVLIFPTDKLTLIYDTSTLQWHKRTSYANDGPWRPGWIVREGKTILAGDRTNGKIYKLDPDTYTDDGQPIRWEFTLQNVNSENKMIVHDWLELKIQSGVGLVSGQGSDPKLWMTYSDDDGASWSREKWKPMGKMGERQRRIRWPSLGRSRGRIYKFGGTDPVKKLIVNANLEGRVLGY